MLKSLVTPWPSSFTNPYRARRGRAPGGNGLGHNVVQRDALFLRHQLEGPGELREVDLTRTLCQNRHGDTLACPEILYSFLTCFFGQNWLRYPFPAPMEELNRGHVTKTKVASALSSKPNFTNPPFTMEGLHVQPLHGLRPCMFLMDPI